jgi:hypothetical protein
MGSVSDIRKKASDTMDEFIRAWEEANPKKE